LCLSPPYPISELAEITSILAQPCQAYADHFLVIFVGGKFRVNTLVMDPKWDGPLFVLRYVGANGNQMVAECVGRDSLGRGLFGSWWCPTTGSTILRMS